MNCTCVTMSAVVTSQRNKRKIVDDDANVCVHNSYKESSPRFITGHCGRKNCCHAKFRVSNGGIIRHVGEHTHGHGPNSDAVKANSLLNEMVHEAETTQNTTRNIISSSVNNKENSVLAALPSRTKIAQRI